MALIPLLDSPPEIDLEQPASLPSQPSFASQLLAQSSRSREAARRFLDPSFIPHSTAAVESLFSMVGWLFDSRRLATTPLHLEQQVFLRVNRGYWSESTILKL